MASAPSTLPWWRTWTRWTQSSPNEAQAASQGLLSLVQGPPINSSNVAVGPGPDNYLHTISNRPVPEESLVAGTRAHTTAGTGELPATLGGPPVVLMPGYGAGVGFYFKNLGPLSSAVRLYGVDWLGTGLSGRPKYHAKTREAAEAFFIDSLSMWRSKVGLEKERMVLVGHSLGGYLAAAYALKHPEHIEHLVLVCPAGVPKAPEDWQKAFLGGRSGLRTQMFKAAMWAWESGVTPHSVIRALGPWGPKICDRYVVNRFSHQGDGFAEQEMHWFQKYFYGIIAAQGSGEYALRHLLAPGAWAHEPLVSRLKELKVPVTFIYGESDWMRPQHAVDLCRELKKERPPKVESDLHVEIIEDAGHFVFIDQPELFHHALLRACSKYFDKPFLASPTSKGEDSSMWRRPENEAQAQTSPSS